MMVHAGYEQTTSRTPTGRRDASPFARTTGAGETNAGGWEQLFWTIFERSRDPCILVDERRQIIELNEPASALLGKNRLELLGTSIVDSVPPPDRGRAARFWYRLVRSGEAAGRRRVIRSDGSELEVDVAANLTQIGGRSVALYSVTEADCSAQPSARRTLLPSLTQREREVVSLIALGHETSQIGAKLTIAPETVKSHVRNAMSKLGARTRAQLVARALYTGQIVPRMEDESAEDPAREGCSTKVG